MQKYFNNAFNRNGIPLVSATVTVYNYGTTTLSSLFSDNTGTTVKTNPITTDANGHFEFYAANARYTISVVATGYVNNTYDDILLNDTYSASPSVIVGGSVDASPIGATTPSTGVFTKLTSTGSTTGAGLDAINFGATGVPTRLGWNNSGNYYNWIEAGGSPGATYLRFATNNSEVARITNTGLDVTGTLSATGAVSGAGFATYLASPPAIGGTTPNAGTFTSLNGGPLAGFRNRIINGDMRVSQRGTSIAAVAGTATYTLDRWFAWRNTTAALTVSQIAGTNQQYAIKLQRTAADATVNPIILAQTIETANCYGLAGNSVTVSFYCKTGTNYSGGNVTVGVLTGTGVDQGSTAMIGGTWTTYAASFTTITPTSTLTRYTVTSSIPAGTTEVGVRFGHTPSGTAGADDSITYEAIQLEVGSAATPFEQRPIGTELALCQRYYYRYKAIASSDVFCMGQATTTLAGEMKLQFPVPLRIVPTALEQSGTATDYRMNSAAGSGIACSAVPVHVASTTTLGVFSTTVAAGLVAGNATCLIAASGAAGYLGWSAEL